MTAYQALQEKDKDKDLTLSIMKKHYKNRTIDPKKICEDAASCFKSKDKPYNIYCYASQEKHTLSIEFCNMRSWNGDLTEYSCTVECEPGWIISSIEPIQCSQYYYSEARGDCYKNRRSSSFDYFILDMILDYACCEDDGYHLSQKN